MTDPITPLAVVEATSAPATDTWTVRAVVVALLIVALVGEVGTVYLIARDTDPASVGLVAQLPTVAVGALAAVLASTRSVK